MRATRDFFRVPKTTGNEERSADLSASECGCCGRVTTPAACPDTFATPGQASGPSLPPAAILVPLKGGTEANARSIKALLAQQYPEFQVIVGMQDTDTQAISLVHSLQAEAGGHRLRLAPGPNRLGGRPKVGNLHNALACASAPVIAMVDADIIAGPDFIQKLLAPLQNDDVGLTTCLYRGSLGGPIWTRMDALWNSTTYLPSALVGRRVIGDRFAFGAAIGMRRNVLDRVGGFAAIAPRVGDDYQLGRRTADIGLRVVFVPYIVTEQMDNFGFRQFMERRVRWSRTIRTFQPAGYAGSVVTYGLPLGLAGAILTPGRWAWSWLVLVCANRVLCAHLNRQWLDPDAPPLELALAPLRDAVALLVWVLGFTHPPGGASSRP